MTKIEANLRDLRLKYVVGADEGIEEDEGSDIEIAVEDLFFTQ